MSRIAHDADDPLERFRGARTPTLKVRTPERTCQDDLSEALGSVIEEYSKNISQLACLTADLPKRLQVVAGSDCSSISSSRRFTPRIATSDGNSKLVMEAVPPVPAHHACIELDSETDTTSKTVANAIGATDLAAEADCGPEGSSCSRTSQRRSSSMSKSSSSRRKIFEEKLHNMISVANATHSVPTGELMELAKYICPCMTSSHSSDEHPSKHVDPIDYIFTGFRSGKFDLVVGLLILANCVMMMVQLEYVGYKSQITIGEREDDGSWANAKQWFDVLEHVFNALFILELVVRFKVFGHTIIWDKSILLDIVLVTGSSIQIYLIEPLQSSNTDALNLSFFRMLRFIKFIRIFRLVRVLRLFSDLRVLVNTIISSFGALVWSMILLVVIMVMSGLFLSEMLKDFITDDKQDMSQRKWVFKHYGTSTRATYTLFEVTLAGCWPTYFRPLIDSVSVFYVLFAVGYISLVVFAIIRIITAIFLKETLLIASNDAEMMIQEKLRQKEIYVSKLECVFKAVDTSGDGKLNRQEFLQIVWNPAVKVWLQVLELEVHDAEALFRLLDDGSGEIGYEEFLKGVLRLKGQARTMDVVAILHQTDRTLNAVTTLHTEVDILKSRFAAVSPSRPQAIGTEIPKVPASTTPNGQDKQSVRRILKIHA